MNAKTTVQNTKMPMREVLAMNLTRWMAGSLDLDTQMKLTTRSGVSQTSIGRILSAQVSPSLDILEKLAEAFGRDVPELIARPEYGTINYDRNKYAQLGDAERKRVESFIEDAIETYFKYNPDKVVALKTTKTTRTKK